MLISVRQFFSGHVWMLSRSNWTQSPTRTWTWSRSRIQRLIRFLRKPRLKKLPRILLYGSALIEKSALLRASWTARFYSGPSSERRGRSYEVQLKHFKPLGKYWQCVALTRLRQSNYSRLSKLQVKTIKSILSEYDASDFLGDYICQKLEVSQKNKTHVNETNHL